MSGPWPSVKGSSVMLRRFFLLVFLLGLTSLGLDSAAELDATGVVVFSVGQGSFQQAGIREGDVLKSWRKDGVGGAEFIPIGQEIDSYLSWAIFLEEEIPRGNITISGRRNGDRFEVFVGPGKFDAKVRPFLPLSLERDFKRGLVLQDSGEVESAVVQWQSLVDSSRNDVAVWALLTVGEAWREAKEFRKSIDSYRTGAGQARDVRFEVAIRKAIGDTYKAEGDFLSAEIAYVDALKMSREDCDECLMVAGVLEKLGSLAWSIRDLDEAEDYFNASLEIRGDSAPKSLLVAITKRALGAVAFGQGEYVTAQGLWEEAKDIQEKLAPRSSDLAETLNSLGRSHPVLPFSVSQGVPA